jgi:hypothetical protein
MPKYYMPVILLYAKPRIRQVLNHIAMHLYGIVLRHLSYREMKLPPLKLAFLSSDSYWCVMT